MPKLQKILNMAIGIRTLVPESTITKMQSRPFGFCKLGRAIGIIHLFTLTLIHQEIATRTQQHPIRNREIMVQTHGSIFQ